jgi:hypothetical protein
MNICRRALSQDTSFHICSGGCQWLSTEEAAAYLKTTRRNLLNDTYLKRVPFYKRGRKNIYLSCELDLLILRGKNGNQV